MSNSRNLADLLDANGDVKATSLDNTSLGGLTDATTTATSNLGLGTGAVDAITTGDYNVGVGDNALTANTTGGKNTASGYQSLYSNTTGYYNTANGYQALYSNTTASSNTAVGYASLVANTTGGKNVAVGSSALYLNTTGANNTASGWNALYANTTGANNTATGYEALKSGQSYTAGTFTVGVTFVIAVVGTTDFTLIGASANTVGISFVSTGLGTGTGTATSRNTGSDNTANGWKALSSNTTGTNNTAVGRTSLYNNTTARYNSGFGQHSLYTNSTGEGNVALGREALYGLTSGSDNTAAGHRAGDNITTGGNNIIIGANVDAPSSTASNQLNIGNTIYGNTSTGSVGINTTSANTKLQVSGSGANNLSSYFCVEGNYPVVYFRDTEVNQASFAQYNDGSNFYIRSVPYANRNDANPTLSMQTGVYLSANSGSWGSTSDENLKTNLVPIENGLAKVNTLRSVIGEFIDDAESKRAPFLIAQDVQAVLPEAVETIVQKFTNENDEEDTSSHLGLQYTAVIPLLVAAIKELTAKNDALEARLIALENA